MQDNLEVIAGGAAADAVRTHVPTLVEEKFASRLFAQDPTLWGAEAESEASIRLSWVGLARSSRHHVGEIEALADELREAGVDTIVLCGMGGSSLAPEVICYNAGVPLTVLDSSDPAMVGAAVREVSTTAVVISSKSGSTVETDSQRRAFIAAFEAAGIDPTSRIVIVTDPGSPMDQAARADGYRVINADPNVGGRFSALTAFGLVPSGLAGADIAELLDQADAAMDLLAADDEANPGLRLGAAMAGTDPLRDKLMIAESESPLIGFGDWAEQLIAESTGKNGTGILPVVITEDPDEEPLLETPADDMTLVTFAGEDEDEDAESGAASAITVSGSLGAQFLLWEVATAVAGRLLGVNPFDQPDVESAKKAAREVMENPSTEAETPDFTDGDIEGFVLGEGLGSPTSVEEALDALVDAVDAERGYVAVMAYLDRWVYADLALARQALSARTSRPVTFGWGPRFLHSTGQFHKGGPRVGVYLQITGTPASDLPVPGKDYSFGQVIHAQAAGDATVLADLGAPVLRLHLKDVPAGLSQLAGALGIPDPTQDEA